MQFSEIRKTIINIATTIVAATPWVLQTEGVVSLPPSVIAVISGVLGLAGWLVHYWTPNVTTDPAVAATSSVKLKSPVAHKGSHTKPAG